MQNLKILAIQSPLVWEDAAANRSVFEDQLKLDERDVDLILLPETFTTGFPVDPNHFSETIEGPSIQWMHQMAAQKNAVVCGSLLLDSEGEFTNSLIWMLPDGSYERYDKRHRFSMGGEHETIRAGQQQLVVELKGWRIRPMICYDLRFPVWSKNTLSDVGVFDYDLAFYIANWPAVRSYPWITLLKARAMENLSYIIGLNRVGEDGLGNHYNGDSLILDPKGLVLSQANNQQEILYQELSYKELERFRKKFNAGLDWDQFKIFVD